MSAEIVTQINALYLKRDEQLAAQDFKAASETHFEFHRLVYANWPAIHDALQPKDASQ